MKAAYILSKSGVHSSIT